MSNEGWAIVTLVAVLGIPMLLAMWSTRGKIQVCLDPMREIMCEYLTPEEYDDHLAEQRRIDEHIRQRRCGNQRDRRCV
jgi:hypothetical protein